ncbi:MAG: hypothetical protein V8Q65_00090 [Bacteroidaceae bacterium]
MNRRIPVKLPDLKGREDILKVHARKVKVADDIDYNKVARMASGASGAELANIVNEAALRAVRDGRKLQLRKTLKRASRWSSQDIRRRMRYSQTRKSVSWHITR